MKTLRPKLPRTHEPIMGSIIVEVKGAGINTRLIANVFRFIGRGGFSVINRPGEILIIDITRAVERYEKRGPS
mgnify:CR=1 FL=1